MTTIRQASPSHAEPWRLAALAQAIAPMLYAAYQAHAGMGPILPWETCPSGLREELEAQAERAVMAVDATREGHAIRRARIWLRSWIREAFHLAWVTQTRGEDERYEHLVRAALNTIEQHVIAVDPAQQMFDLHGRVLVHGPEAAFVKPIAIGRAT